MEDTELNSASSLNHAHQTHQRVNFYWPFSKWSPVANLAFAAPASTRKFPTSQSSAEAFTGNSRKPSSEIRLNDDPREVHNAIQFLYNADYEIPPPSSHNNRTRVPPPNYPHCLSLLDLVDDYSLLITPSNTSVVDLRDLVTALLELYAFAPKQSLTKSSENTLKIVSSTTHCPHSFHDFLKCYGLNRQRVELNPTHLIPHAKIYAIAGKYGIPSLQDLARDRFSLLLHNYYESVNFVDIIWEVFTSTNDEDRGLKDVVLDALEDRPEPMLDEGVWEVMNRCVPGFVRWGAWARLEDANVV
ncbi:uncharacterized protein BDR25DRAFT_381343 [Lindgomyces ingoldianus]|uniref:Uncharacterized protein n=1 Tax=Lindgomyces ingoldianus TaxID=673940 RepID=A0ACB6QBF9_9PLEO|nr:uncharacterized protein BDR25DRAFT_381343 [Lindgomyces ingoldianus]KAF2464231.1 hypothetical protein BDR25DRAFT_381343 [Lindgomyces ingoldianus]